LATKTICGVDLRSTQYGAFDHMRDIKLEFSDGSTESLTMAKNDERQSFRFRPHTTEWVIVHLVSTYADGAGGINVNSSGLSEVALYEPTNPSKPGGRERLVKLMTSCVHASDDAGWDPNWSVQNIADGKWGTPPYYPDQQWMARNTGTPGKSVWCRIDFEPRRTSLGVPIPINPAAVTESGSQDRRADWGVTRLVDGVWATDFTPASQWKVNGLGTKGADNWCRIGFGKEREVFEIDMQGSRFPGSSRIKDIRVEFSNGQSRDVQRAPQVEVGLRAGGGAETHDLLARGVQAQPAHIVELNKWEYSPVMLKNIWRDIIKNLICMKVLQWP
jgi:hypothetical protein